MTHSGNLPADAAGFVGRASDLASLDRCIDAGERLVTLTGPGGMGKTRLAIRWATTRRERFPGGAWLIDLAAARDLDALCASVARAMDLPMSSGTPAQIVERIGRQLAAHGRALVVLDNLEQLVEAGAEAIALWHGGAPETTFLLTSREALRVSAESCWELSPIALPAADAAQGDVVASEAFALLADRVRRARGKWDPDPSEIAAAGTLLRKLDGIPLAIELAAARLATIDTASLSERLERTIDALGRGPRDRSARQRTLRTTVEWSLDLLSPVEIDAFALSAVFAGGFDLDAADAIIPIPDAALAVGSLRERSLLRAYEPTGMAGARRLGAYETIGAIAAERFASHALAEDTRWRHATHYATIGEALALLVDRRGGRDAMQRLVLEQENLLAAARWLIAARPPREGALDLAFRCVLAIEPALSVQGLFQRKHELLCALLAAFPDAPPRWLGLALEARALTRNTLGRRAEGSEDLERALTIARAIGDRGLEGRILRGIARAVWTASERVVEMVQQACVILREVGDRRELGIATNTLAVKNYELGRRAEGDVLFRESQQIFREVGDVRWEGIAWCQLALSAIEGSRWDDAERAIAEGAAKAEVDGAWNVAAMVVQARATLAHMQGRLDAAAPGYDEVLRIHRRVANLPFVGIYLGYRAIVDRERGMRETARAFYLDSIAALAEVGEGAHRAIFTAQLGGLLAELGLELEAEARLDDAEAMTRAESLPGARSVIELERAQLDLARAARATGEGDGRAARTARESAVQRRERARDLEPDERTSIDIRLSARHLDRALGAARAPSIPPPAATPAHVLAVQRDGAWFRMPAGEKVGCAGRHVARRLLMALVRARVDARGEPVTQQAMLEAGWPGEQIHPEAARNRLHVAISTLRKLGLKDALQNRGDGYLIDPDVPVVWVD